MAPWPSARSASSSATSAPARYSLQTLFAADHGAVKPTEADVFGVISLGTAALHESIVIISIETTRTPYVSDEDRLVVDDLGYEDDGISHLTAKVGFQEAVKVPHLFALACTRGLEGDANEADAVYYLSQVAIRPTDGPGMRRWRKHLDVAQAVAGQKRATRSAAAAATAVSGAPTGSPSPPSPRIVAATESASARGA